MVLHIRVSIENHAIKSFFFFLLFLSRSRANGQNLKASCIGQIVFVTKGGCESSDTQSAYLYKPFLYLRLNLIYINDVYIRFVVDRREKKKKGEFGMLKMGG